MLWEGQELGEDFTLPGNGLGKVALLRPVNWDYFYDTPGAEPHRTDTQAPAPTPPVPRRSARG
jgi:hypothetical protein